MTITTKDTRTSRQIVIDAIQELAALNQGITRKRLQEATGLTYHIIDDHVSRMVDEDGTLRRVEAGVFELVKGYEAPRPVYFADLDDGSTVIEVGDQKMVLWPRETRMVAKRLAGDMQQLATLQLSRDVGAMAQGLELEMRAQKRDMNQLINEQKEEIAKLKLKLAQRSPQFNLGFDVEDATPAR